MLADVTVIILTYNEGPNIEHALQSACGWARQVFVFDSFSTDDTVSRAARFDCQVAQHAFVDYGSQRNAALTQLPIQTEWVFFLDADEWMPDDLKAEISGVIARRPVQNGFYVKYRLMWMGKWIRRGYYPNWILRLFRTGKARCEDRTCNEHLVVDGQRGYLERDFIHEDRKGLTEWVAKHNRYASREAEEMWKACSAPAGSGPTGEGETAVASRGLRSPLWLRLPPVLRPFLYFFYRYVVRGGFLDGREGFTFHFLQGLWYILLIDLKYLELKGWQSGRSAR